MTLKRMREVCERLTEALQPFANLRTDRTDATDGPDGDLDVIIAPRGEAPRLRGIGHAVIRYGYVYRARQALQDALAALEAIDDE